MEERWKAIPGYAGIYEASDRGRIRSKRYKKTRVMHPCVTWQGKRGDARVTLKDEDGVRRSPLVARLVAAAFLGVPDKGMTVNHINGDSLDNRADNLEYCTAAENLSKGHAAGAFNSIYKPITLYDGSGASYTFPSQRQADRWLGHKECYTANALRRGLNIYDASGVSYTVSTEVTVCE